MNGYFMENATISMTMVPATNVIIDVNVKYTTILFVIKVWLKGIRITVIL